MVQQWRIRRRREWRRRKAQKRSNGGGGRKWARGAGNGIHADVRGHAGNNTVIHVQGVAGHGGRAWGHRVASTTKARTTVSKFVRQTARSLHSLSAYELGDVGYVSAATWYLYHFLLFDFFLSYWCFECNVDQLFSVWVHFVRIYGLGFPLIW